MSITFAAITPHPPIIIPGVGSKEDMEKVSKTIQAMQELAADLKNKKIETAVVITPHGKPSKSFTIYHSKRFTCPLPGKVLSFEYDLQLGTKIAKLADVKKTTTGNLDHGAAVPLYYLKETNPLIKAVPLIYPLQNPQKIFDFGKKLGELIKNEKKKIAIIASGDLSHRLTPAASAGYSEEGKKFDKKLIELIEKDQVQKILNFNQDLIVEAGQCAYNSIITLLGILSELKYTPKKISYEGPFGVGYAVIKYFIK